METTLIYTFLSELKRCDYHALEAGQDLSSFRYNDVSYSEGAESYQNKLTRTFDEFKSAILSLSMRDNSQKVLSMVLADFQKALDQYWDIPDNDVLLDLQIEYEKYKVPETLKTIREVKFLQEMSSLQKWMLQEAMCFIAALIDNVDTDKARMLPASVAEPKAAEEEKIRIINGVQGLADYLGCSKSKAMDIVRSRILQKSKIQYKVGECWRFNREKLDDFLATNPEALTRKRGI